MLVPAQVTKLPSNCVDNVEEDGEATFRARHLNATFELITRESMHWLGIDMAL